MSDDPAVQAAIEAGDQHWLVVRVLTKCKCWCGEVFPTTQAHIEHRMTMGVEAARPIIVAQVHMRDT